jgi:hypothetical protein
MKVLDLWPMTQAATKTTAQYRMRSSRPFLIYRLRAFRPIDGRRIPMEVLAQSLESSMGILPGKLENPSVQCSAK